MGQRRLGIGVDRNASLDEESAAGSGGIAGCLEPASERESTEERVLPDEGVFRVPGGYVVQTGSNAGKSRRGWAGRWVIGKRWYELPEEVDGGP